MTSDWYERKIEEPIRSVVKLLRDNGFNTVFSCGHEMYCESEYYGEDLTRLSDLLSENGYSQFEIIVRTGINKKGCKYARFRIWLPKTNGEFSEQIKEWQNKSIHHILKGKAKGFEV